MKYLYAPFLLAIWIPLAGAQTPAVDVHLGFGALTDSATGGGIDNHAALNPLGACKPGTAADPNCQATSQMNAFFMGAGADVMLRKQYGVGVETNFMPHVGEETAFDLAQRFGSVEKLMSASKEEINAIPNIGEVVAESAFDWFQNKHNVDFVKRLLKAGVRIEKIKIHKTPLTGKSLVVTGTLEKMSRDEAKEAVREAGGDWVGSVSKNTDYVVVGENPGSKADKAKSLGIKILNEKEFLKLLEK